MTENNNSPAAFDSDGTPLMPNGKPMLAFKVNMRKNDDGTVEKAVFIGGEVIDWSVDVSSMMEAMRMGPKYARAMQRDVEKHFVDSVSEFIGRKVTYDEVQQAIKIGWI